MSKNYVAYLQGRRPENLLVVKIALETLKMPDAALAGALGGPTKEEARQTLRYYGIRETK